MADPFISPGESQAGTKAGTAASCPYRHAHPPSPLPCARSAWEGGVSFGGLHPGRRPVPLPRHGPCPGLLSAAPTGLPASPGLRRTGPASPRLRRTGPPSLAQLRRTGGHAALRPSLRCGLASRAGAGAGGGTGKIRPLAHLRTGRPCGSIALGGAESLRFR